MNNGKTKEKRSQGALKHRVHTSCNRNPESGHSSYQNDNDADRMRVGGETLLPKGYLLNCSLSRYKKIIRKEKTDGDFQTHTEYRRDCLLFVGYHLYRKEVEQMNVGDNIRRIRERTGLTQAYVAKQAGISQAMLCQIERGTKNPSLQVGKEIANILGCELDVLLADSHIG